LICQAFRFTALLSVTFRVIGCGKVVELCVGENESTAFSAEKAGRITIQGENVIIIPSTTTMTLFSMLVITVH
jgi:hypothetical protein